MKLLKEFVGLTAVFGASTVFLTPALAQPKVETFVMATAGLSSDGIFSFPKPVAELFGLGEYIPHIAETDPTQLANANISGTWRRQKSSQNTTLTDSTAVSASIGPPRGPWSYQGSATATAQQGQLRAASYATQTGGYGNCDSTLSYALFRDTLTPMGNNVPASGVMQIEMTIDGSMSVVGKGSASLEFAYGYGPAQQAYPYLEKDANRTLLTTRLEIYGNGYTIFGPHSSEGSYTIPSGMNLSVGPLDGNGSPASLTFGGTGKVYAYIPFSAASPTEFTMGMLTSTHIPSFDATVSSDFGHTATMTGIRVFDDNNREVTDFSILSASGAQYTANGIVLPSAAAPEPGALALLAAVGLPCVGFLARRARRASSVRRVHGISAP